MVHDPTWWSGRRVLVTGHTGFKGSWLTSHLVQMGAVVMGVSLPEPSRLYDSLELDLADDVRKDIGGQDWQARVVAFSPQVVIHMAAQALVSVGYADPVTTFRTNTLGTVNVMAVLDRLPDLEAALVVTTDKVYDTRQPQPYREDSFLGGRDPYAASKAAAELATHSWPTRHRVATARAGNVIGGGDYSANRIVPDLVRYWSEGEELVLRRPESVRPWQHVIEPLIGYLAYCESLARGRQVPDSLNFGPDARDAVSVAELVEHAAVVWAEMWPDAKTMWRVDAPPHWAEAGLLTLDASASKTSLGLENRWGWRETVHQTLRWYQRCLSGERPLDLIQEQFATYLEPSEPGAPAS